MWVYQLWVYWNGDSKALVIGSRQEVMAVMCSSRNARLLQRGGATAWELRQVFVSQVR